MGNAPIITLNEIGKRITLRRVERGFSQEMLARLLNVACWEVQRYESGEGLTIENLQYIARALEAPVAYFFHEQGSAAASVNGTCLSEEEQRVVELFQLICSGEMRVLMVNLLKAAAQGKTA